MGDNKISEAARVTTGHCKNHAQPGGCHPNNLQCGYPACDRREESHLQGEAVEYQYRFWNGSANDGKGHWSNWQQISKSDYEREKGSPTEGREVRALYLHPQPAEQSEVSGDSGELGGRYTIQTSVGPMACSVGVASEWEKSEERIRELEAALAATGKQQVGGDIDREQLADLVEGMAVSVDVDGLFSTDGRRLFGTITAVQHEDGEKGGLMLLVQEPEPNWKPVQVGEVQTRQQICDRLGFLEGLVSESTYRRIADEAVAIQQAALASRQPVGEPVACRYRHRRKNGQWFPWNYTDSVPSQCIKGYEYEALYTAPPAQGIDLGAVRDLLQRRRAQWASHLPEDPNAPGTRAIRTIVPPHWTEGETDYNNDVALNRQGIAVMDEALALIDGKAVGK